MTTAMQINRELTNRGCVCLRQGSDIIVPRQQIEIHVDDSQVVVEFTHIRHHRPIRQVLDLMMFSIDQVCAVVLSDVKVAVDPLM